MASKTYVSIREGNAPLTLSVNVEGGMYNAKFDPYFTTSDEMLQKAIESDALFGVEVDEAEKIFNKEDEGDQTPNEGSSKTDDTQNQQGGDEANKATASPKKATSKKKNSTAN